LTRRVTPISGVRLRGTLVAKRRQRFELCLHACGARRPVCDMVTGAVGRGLKEIEE
jgi:hypothetical protein